MIVFSSFNNVELFHSMFADCCMLKSWKWGPMAAIGRQRSPSSIDIVHVVGILSSPSSSSYFAATAATHLSPTMSLPGQRRITTNLAKRLPSQQLQCWRGCSLSPCQVSIANCVVYYPTYFYVGHNSQQPHNVCRHVLA